MFSDYIYEMSSAKYEKKILLIDEDNLESKAMYSSVFTMNGFVVARYDNDLSFRIKYEELLKDHDSKIVVIAEPEQYIPYDIKSRFRAFVVSIANLFPKLNAETLRNYKSIDYNLLCSSYDTLYESLECKSDTEQFLKKSVYGVENVRNYMIRAKEKLIEDAREANTHNDWFSVAEEKAYIDVLSVKYDVHMDTSEINGIFCDYILTNYGKLSGDIDSAGPVLVSKAMDYMDENSDRFVVIVMDGMAEFDWRVLEKSFDGIDYEKSSAFAMIPTVTSISRQCLLSNKYPSQLLEPWKQSKEKQEFVECAKGFGYTDQQISYMRGYDSDFGSMIRCGAVIINEIDDMVHGQKQGRIGMYNDIGVMSKQGKLAEMVRRVLSKGLDVYITSDHGNTVRQGMGRLMGTGVETETKSRCMIVLKDFADKSSLIEKYDLLEFPKTYLPKEYDYLICNAGDSFDVKGEEVMSHGGITIDEVIVPFIKIKAVNNNG